MSTLSLVRQIKPEWGSRMGNASGNKLTARAAAFIIAGHELHHLKILHEQYHCK